MYDFNRDRLPITELHGAWRFEPGDDPSVTKVWASTSFDDSSWRIVHSGKSWNVEPEAVFAGSAWFRAKVLIPAGSPELSLYLPAVLFNYQLYADGHLLGGQGEMPPNPSAARTHPLLLVLPYSSSAHTVVLALRVWRWPQWNYYYRFALPDGIQVGETQLLTQELNTKARESSWDDVANLILLFVELLFGLAALVLFVLRRSELANLWFGLMLVFSAANRGWGIWPSSHSVSIATYYIVLQALSSLTRLAQVFFYFNFLRGKPNWLFWSAVAAATLIAVADYPLFFPRYFPATVAAIPIVAWIGLISALQAAPSMYVFPLLFRRTWEGLEDARLLVVPTVLKQATPILFFVGHLGYYGFSWRPALLARLDEISTSPFSYSYYDLADGLFLLAMLGILIQRFVRTAAQQEDHQRERESARAVQHIMVPDVTPVIPGFDVQSVYLPYGEVGGDFFQVVPSPDSSVLIAIGDVSGKGLPAAMTVALLVGTFRTLAMNHREPSQILSLMNQLLAGRGGGGFTTCLVLRADQDGTLTVANAGHISPYLDGEELEQESGLPLGIVEQSAYGQAFYRFGLKSELTLLTDGVVEARNGSGELFGFARTAVASKRPVAEIAQLATGFGQDDDITVLKLVRVA